MAAADNALALVIRSEIQAQGPLSCARFMELALYHPLYGYYRRPSQQIGCQGDFYTSPAVGPLFGQLLAFQFAEWLDALAHPASFPDSKDRPGRLEAVPAQPAATVCSVQLLEAGAHDGHLAADVLAWLRDKRPDLLERTELWILEPSPAQKQRQAARLQPFAKQVRWFDNWSELAPASVSGVIFSNELLDAFPAFRVGWDAHHHAWFEWRVAAVEHDFQWIRSAVLSPGLDEELDRPFWRELPGELLRVLPDGFTVDLCPKAREWWSLAAQRLAVGKILTFDYGLEASEFLAPHRQNGTLRGYQAHRTTPDVLAHPGSQDLTAHVNFTDLQIAGELAGLTTEYFGRQEIFLTRVVQSIWKDPSRFGTWTAAETRQFQSLSHPQHLGRVFQVLIQGRAPAFPRSCLEESARP